LETFEKRKKWFHELKRLINTTKTTFAKVSTEPKTFGTANLKHIHYAMMSVPLEWQTGCFIQTATWQAGEKSLPTNKRFVLLHALNHCKLLY